MTKLKVPLYRCALFFITLIFIVPNVWTIYFNQNFVYPKWVILDFTLAAVTLLLAFEGQLRLPPKKLLIVLGLMIFTRLIPTVTNLNWVVSNSFIYAMSFGILSLYFMTVWKRYDLKVQTFYWPLVLCCYAISIFVALQFYNSRILAGNPEPLFFSGPFGNINMMCEYLVFMLPFGFLVLRQMEGWKSWLLQVGLTCWITIVMVGQGRSAWMALALYLGYSIWRGLNKREWISFLIPVALYFAAQSIPTNGMNYAEAKKGSFNKRLTLYHGATRMLADQPLGIGGGEFEYGYLPYQMSTEEAPVEREKFNTPHNEFLKWGIENGWAYLLVMCAWWFFLGQAVWKIQATKEVQTFYRTSFLVLGPQMFFQFPFENPASYMVMALMIGLMLAAGKTQELNLKKWGRFAVGALAVLLLVRATTLTASRWVESQYTNDRNAMEIGCPLDRNNWRLCFLYSMALLDFYPDDALKVVKLQLNERPFDYHALRALAFFYIKNNRLKESCEITQVYDSLFLGTSLFTPFIKDNCKLIPNPIPFKSSEEFNRDYRKWVSGYLTPK
jgi:hypothetical protein